MSPDCQAKHDARVAIFKAAEDSPKHGNPHFGEAWTEAFNAYQDAVMEPLRRALRDACTSHEQGVCCAPADEFGTVVMF